MQFSALFTTPLHHDENVFDIIDVSSQVFEWLISFAYLRNVTFINEKNVFEIYMIADYFGVLGLMKACVDYILKLISPATCIGWWLIGR
jgi:BTB/POZ domain